MSETNNDHLLLELQIHYNSYDKATCIKHH